MLLEERNISYPTIGGTPRNPGTRTLKGDCPKKKKLKKICSKLIYLLLIWSFQEIFMNDFSGIIPDGLYSGEDYIKHIIIQGLGYDTSGIMTEFLTREFFTNEILRNGTFEAMLPGLIDVIEYLYTILLFFLSNMNFFSFLILADWNHCT